VAAVDLLHPQNRYVKIRQKDAVYVYFNTIISVALIGVSLKRLIKNILPTTQYVERLVVYVFQ
jgi:hypothetical protein